MIFYKFYYYLLHKIKYSSKKHSLKIIDKPVHFWKPFIFLLPSLIIVILFTVLPFIFSIDRSITDQVDSADGEYKTIVYSANIFSDVIQDKTFQVGLRNSVVYSLTALPISLIISLIIASTIAHVYNKFARGFWQTVFFLPYVTSSIAIATSFAYLFNTQTGLINKIFGLNIYWLDDPTFDGWNAFFVILIEGVWKNVAFQILILTSAMLSINTTLYKAASIDGASKFKQFFKITLPSIGRSINLLIILGILSGVKVFPLALYPNNPNYGISNGASTLMLLIYKYVKSGDYNYAGVVTVLLFFIGILYSVILRNTLKIIVNFATKLRREHRVKRLMSQTSYN